MKSIRKGFTLIELLVVISIIGLLASVILASLNSARSKSRDARRVSDMHQITNALYLYAADHNGQYPPPTYSGGSHSGWESSDLEGEFFRSLTTIHEQSIRRPNKYGYCRL